MDAEKLEYSQVPYGEIKVNAKELHKYILMSEGIWPKNQEFLDYFIKRYVVIPDVRLQEQEAYEMSQKAKEIAKTAGEEGIVKEFENSYRQKRSERMELQEECRIYQETHGVLNAEPRQEEVKEEKKKQQVRKAYQRIGR